MNWTYEYQFEADLRSWDGIVTAAATVFCSPLFQADWFGATHTLEPLNRSCSPPDNVLVSAMTYSIEKFQSRIN